MVDREQEAIDLLRKLLDAYIDACWQGTGNEPLSHGGWHNFLSAYEEADYLIPEVKLFLGDPITFTCVSCGREFYEFEGQLQGLMYCHPADSMDETCYQKALREAGFYTSRQIP